MRLLLRGLSCALLLAACSTTELELDPGFGDPGDDAPSDAHDLAPGEDGAARDAALRDAASHADDAAAPFDGGRAREECTSRALCSNSGPVEALVCTVPVPGLTRPSAGVHQVCLVDAQRRVLLTRLRGDLTVTNSGWTHSSYGVVRSTLREADSARCVRALEAQRGEGCVSGFEPSAPPDAGVPIPNGLTCSGLDRTIGLNLDDAARLVSTSCTADADCAAWTARFECPALRARLEYCPRALARSQVSIANAFVDQMESLLCPRLTGPNCGAAPSCRELTARCVEGQCTMRR